ncbi:MAG TPA: hypothetical protein VIC24_17660 [Gemmatimonadaceae bacterium]
MAVLPTDAILLRRAGKLVRERHANDWAALNVSTVHSIAFMQFVRTKAYLALNDPDLTNLLQFKRRFDVLTTLAFVAAVAAVLL